MRVQTSPALAACIAAILLGACASTPPASAVPDALKVGANESLLLSAAAKGVQIYECRAGKEPGAPDELSLIHI